MSEYRKVKLKISYEIECTLKQELYWEGATEEEMIKLELANANEDPSIYLDIGLTNETYKVVVEEI